MKREKIKEYLGILGYNIEDKPLRLWRVALNLLVEWGANDCYAPISLLCVADAGSEERKVFEKKIRVLRGKG